MQKRRPTSPGILAALRARKIAVAALYWGPIIFLLSTIVLVVSLWKGINLGSLQYLAVLLLAAGGVASAWTLQRRLAEISVALERAQRTSTVGLLTAGFAHEMKNALTVVLGFAELARTAAERAQSDAKVTRHLKELENETRRTVAQLQSFLSYSAGEKVARRPQDVNELVNEALQMVRPMARMKDLQLEQAAGEPPRVDADPFAIRQLLLNLLLNALDFARSRISISTTRTKEGRAEVVVADDGAGVSPENRERIFQRFVTTRPGGNGLGLSTSRDIARAHGGTLTLRDGGGGATFVLTLPPA
ncbi:MAG: HAMP domain-containing histidine kinase [Deltaproteobacteria bacterium]|nr:MAG: HAMP domain-containing histidine kinase [Deltaproteobacteria bacterium]